MKAWLHNLILKVCNLKQRLGWEIIVLVRVSRRNVNEWGPNLCYPLVLLDVAGHVCAFVVVSRKLFWSGSGVARGLFSKKQRSQRSTNSWMLRQRFTDANLWFWIWRQNFHFSLLDQNDQNKLLVLASSQPPRCLVRLVQVVRQLRQGSSGLAISGKLVYSMAMGSLLESGWVLVVIVTSSSGSTMAERYYFKMLGKLEIKAWGTPVVSSTYVFHTTKSFYNRTL